MTNWHDLVVTDQDQKCQTCGQTFRWHQDNQPRHPFNTGQDGAKDFLGPRRDRDPRTGHRNAQRPPQDPPRVVWPTDPVLRVALINKGVLTTDDLRAAEEQLRAAMGDFTRGPDDGESATEARGRQVQVGEATTLDVG